MVNNKKARLNILLYIHEDPESFYSCFERMCCSEDTCFILLGVGDYSYFKDELKFYFTTNFSDFIDWLCDENFTVAEIQETFKMVGIETRQILNGKDWALEIVEESVH